MKVALQVEHLPVTSLEKLCNEGWLGEAADDFLGGLVDFLARLFVVVCSTL